MRCANPQASLYCNTVWSAV